MQCGSMGGKMNPFSFCLLPSVFYLYSLDFSGMIMISIGVVFFVFTFLGFLWTSQVHTLTSSINFGKLSLIPSSDISSLFLLLFLLWDSRYPNISLFDIVSQLLDILITLLLKMFSLCVLKWVISISIFNPNSLIHVMCSVC